MYLIHCGKRKLGRLETDEGVSIKLQSQKKEREKEEKNTIINRLRIPIFGFCVKYFGHSFTLLKKSPTNL
jgi:hypothetical protein